MDHDADWVVAMRASDFAAAWDISDRDLARSRPVPTGIGPRHMQRIWSGEPLRNRRVLVRCYHGLGDTIQFVRFMAPLREVAAHVTLWCQPELIALLQDTAGIDRLLPLHEGSPDCLFDADIEIMEVPHALRADATMVARPAYLTRSTGRGPAGEKPAGLNVGLIWRAGDWDRRRSIACEAVAVLGRMAGVRIYSLQLGAAPEEVRALGATDLATPNLARLAEIMRSLDLIVTVDTMAAHLAGALGCPVWTLLQRECDWRWPLQGEETIWYPTMRLFHQQVAGDWTGVIDELIAALDGVGQTSQVPPQRKPVFNAGNMPR